MYFAEEKDDGSEPVNGQMTNSENSQDVSSPTYSKDIGENQME